VFNLLVIATMCAVLNKKSCVLAVAIFMLFITLLSRAGTKVS